MSGEVTLNFRDFNKQEFCVLMSVLKFVPNGTKHLSLTQDFLLSAVHFVFETDKMTGFLH